MTKVIRLTEIDLVRLVKRVIKETSEPGFSSWLEENSNMQRVGPFCMSVQRALDGNGYKNRYDTAPEEFKQLVKNSMCFQNSSIFGTHDDNVKVKEALQKSKDNDTIKLLKWMIYHTT